VARIAHYTKALPVYVTPEVRAEIERISDERDISMAELIRELLHDALTRLRP